MIYGLILNEGGGNIPAAAVPLVALGTQSGTIDVVDVSTNAVAASTSVHTGVVRGLRWLGNSRLVSFSYSQVCKYILIMEHVTSHCFLLYFRSDFQSIFGLRRVLGLV